MSEDLELVIADVERYFATGQRSLRDHPGRLPYASGLTASEKQRLNLQRRFADPKCGYTSESLRKLIGEFRKNNYALTPSAIGRLMGVPAGSERDRLIRDAIQGRWPLARIERQIKLSGLTAPRTQGRAVKPPSTLAETLGTLEAEYCPSWVRILDSFRNNESVTLPTVLKGKILIARDVLSDLLATARRLRLK